MYHYSFTNHLKFYCTVLFLFITTVGNTIYSHAQCTVGISGTNTVCNNNTALLEALGTNISSYLWSTGATTSIITPSVSGTYSVTITTTNSCVATANIIVTNCATVNTCPIVIYQNETGISSISDVVSYNNNLTFIATHTGQSNYPGYPEPSQFFYRGDIVNENGILANIESSASVSANNLVNFVNPLNSNQLITGYRTPTGVQYGFEKHYRVWNGSNLNEEFIPPTANSLISPYLAIGSDGIVRGCSFMATGSYLVYHRKDASGWVNDSQITSTGNEYFNVKAVLGTDNTLHVFAMWQNNGINRLDYFTVNPTGSTFTYLGWLTTGINQILDVKLDNDNQINVLFQQNGAIKLAVFVSPTSFNLNTIINSTVVPTKADLFHTSSGQSVISFYENNKIVVVEESNINNRFAHKYIYTNSVDNGNFHSRSSLVLKNNLLHVCFSDNQHVYAANLTTPQTPTVIISSNSGSLPSTLTAVVTPTGIYNYTWFNNGAAISGAPNSPNFTATLAGNYSCLIGNASITTVCSATSNVISFSSALTVNITGNTTICSGTPATLTATVNNGSSPYSYIWSNGATTSSINAATGGTYAVTVTDSTGDTGSDTFTVFVGTTPTASIVGNGFVCNGSSTQLTTATSGSSYLWFFNGNSLGQTTPTITVFSAGTYYVVVNGCPSNIITITNSMPAPTITISEAAGTANDGTVCVGSSLTITANGGTSYNWLLPNGTTATTQTQAINSATVGIHNGNYIVTVTNANGCTATASATITISTLTASITANPTTICEGNSTQLTASGGVSYQWSSNAGNVGNNSTISVSPTNPPNSTTYTVTVSNNNSCTATASSSITVNNPPTAGNDNSINICNVTGTATPTSIDLDLLLSAGVSGGNWSLGFGALPLSSGNVFNGIGVTPGNYLYNYTVSNLPCIDDVAQMSIQVTNCATCTNPPIATFSYSPNSYCIGSGTATITLAAGATAGTFTATPNGISINTTTGAVNLNISNAGTYTVTNTIAASGGCPQTAATSTITIIAQPNAGNNNTATVCNNSVEGTTTVDLDNLLSAGVSGGNWTASGGAPVLGVGNVFNGNGLTTGNYTYNYTVAAPPCTADVATMTITVNDCIANCPTATFSYNPSSYCWGIGTATITLAAGATAGTFTDNSANLTTNSTTGTVTLTGSAAGSYIVTNTIAASGSCPQVTDTANITIVAQPNAGNNNTATVCNNSAEGTTTVDLDNLLSAGVSGGNWTASGGAPVLGVGNVFNGNGLTTGNYTYNYTVAAPPCTADVAMMTITVNDCSVNCPTATFSYSPNSYCIGSGTATITLAAGATAGTFMATPNGISINTTTGAVNLNISNAGTYTVTNTIAASGGCPQITATATITIVAQSNAGNNNTATVCNNSAEGTTTVDLDNLLSAGISGGTWAASGGAPALGVGNVFNGNGLTTGNYTYNYTVAAPPCTADVATMTITVNDCSVNCPTATFSYNPSSYCKGATFTTVATLAAGSVAGTFTAAPAGLSINATTGAVNIAASTVGTYTVTNTIAASGGCPQTAATSTITINQTTATVSSTNNTNCVAPFNGAAILTTNGTSFIWSNGANTQNISGLNAGTYTVTVTGAGGCTASASNAINNAVTLASATALPTANTSCISPNGGVTLITNCINFAWSNGATTQNISGLSTGIYTVTASNANGCSIVVSAIVNSNTNSPTANAGANQTICAGNSTILTASGGNTGASYQWSLGANIVGVTQSITVSPITSVIYVVTVTDSNGCSGSDSVQINVEQAANAGNNNSATVCDNASEGTTTVNLNTLTSVSGGSFTPIATAPTLSGTTFNGVGVALGTYQYNYTVTGTLPCPNDVAIISITVNDCLTCPNPPTAGFSYSNTNFCINAGTITPTLNNGATAGTFTATPTGLAINATNGAINLNTSSAGTYTVTNTVPASGACPQVVATTSITINALPQPTATANPSTICSGNSATLTATGGSSYQWSNGAGSGATVTVSPTTTTTYTVTVSNNAGCVATTSTTVTVNSGFSINAVALPNNICEGQNATLNVIGGGTGATYQWAANGNAISTTQSFSDTPTNSTSYTVTVTNNNGCSATDNVSVVVNDIPPVNLGVDQTICEENTIILSPIFPGDFTYNWSTGANVSTLNISPTETTTYSVTVTSLAGCSASDAVAVIVIPNITITFDNIQAYNASYNAGSCLTDPDPTWLPQIDLDDFVPSNATGGTWGYDADLPTSYYNQATNQIFFANNPVLPGGIYEFTYTVAQVAPCNNAVGVLQVFVNDCSCPSLMVDNATINRCVNDNINIDLTTLETNVDNNGHWAILDGSGGEVVGNSFVLNNASEGTYQVHYVLNNPISGCPSQSLPVTIIVNQLPDITFINVVDITCEGSPIILGIAPNNNYTYQWSGAGISISGNTNTPTIAINAAFIGSNTYNVTVSNNFGCVNTSSTTVFGEELSVITFDSDLVTIANEICPEGSSSLQMSSLLANNTVTTGNWSIVTINPTQDSALIDSINNVLAGDNNLSFIGFPAGAYVFEYSVKTNSCDTVKGTKTISVGFCCPAPVIKIKPNANDLILYCAVASDVYHWGYYESDLDTIGQYLEDISVNSVSYFNANEQFFIRNIAWENSLFDATENSIRYFVDIENEGCGTLRKDTLVALQKSEVGVLSPQIELYPNPNEGLFSLSVLHLSLGELRIQIFNILGQPVIDILTEKQGLLYESPIELPALTTGVYLLDVSINGESVGRKRLLIVH